MADFRADITADISRATSELNNLRTQIQSLSNIRVTPTINGNFGNQGRTCGQQFSNAFQSALNQLKAQTLSNNIETWMNTNRTAAQQFSTELQSMFQILQNPNISSNSLSLVKTQFNQMTSATKEYEASVRQAQTAQETMTKSSTLSNKIEDWMNRNRRAAQEYGDQLRQLQTRLNGNTDSNALKNIANEFNNIKSAAQTAGLTADSFFNRMMGFGGQVIGITSAYQAIRKIIDVCKDGVEAVQQLDEALTNISYTMNVSESDLSNIGNGAMQMAADLGSSATDVLEAVKLYANANESADSILSKAKVATMLGNVTGMSGSESAKSLQTVMNQFGLDQTPEKLEGSLYRVSDALQAVSRNMSYDFSDGIKQMTEGIEASGSVASNAGMSVEEYASMIGLLVEKTGQQGGQLGRSLSTIFQRTTKAGKMEADMDQYLSKSEESLAAIGVKVRNSKGDFRDTLDILGDLAGKWNELDEVERSNISYNMAGIRQSNVLNTLMKNWGEYKHLLGAANDAEGTTLETQDVYINSIEGKLNKLKSTWFEIANQTIDSDSFKSFLDIVTQISEVIGEIGIGTSAIGTAIGGLTLNGLFNSSTYSGVAGLFSLLTSSKGAFALETGSAFVEYGAYLTSTLPLLVAFFAGLSAVAKAMDNNIDLSYDSASALKSFRKETEKYNEKADELNSSLEEQSSYREQLLKVADKYKDQLEKQGIEIKDSDSVEDIIKKLGELKTLSKEDYDIISKVEMDNSLLEERIKLLERELELIQKERVETAKDRIESKSNSYNLELQDDGRFDTKKDKNSSGLAIGEQAEIVQRTDLEQVLYDVEKAKEVHKALTDAKTSMINGETEFNQEYLNNLENSYLQQKDGANALIKSYNDTYNELKDATDFTDDSQVDVLKQYKDTIEQMRSAYKQLNIDEYENDYSDILSSLGVDSNFDYSTSSIDDLNSKLKELKKTRDSLEEGSTERNILDDYISEVESEYKIRLGLEIDKEGIDLDISEIQQRAKENNIDTGDILNFDASKMSIDEITAKIKQLEDLKVKFDTDEEGQQAVDDLIAKLKSVEEINPEIKVKDDGGGGSQVQKKVDVNLEANITNDLNSEISEKVQSESGSVETESEVKVNPIVSLIGNVASKIKNAINGTTTNVDVTTNNTQNSTVNYQVGSKPSASDLAINSKANYTLGTHPTKVPNASGVANYSMGYVPTKLPDATQTVYRSYKDVNYTGTAQMSGVRLPSYANGSVTNRNIAVQHDGMSLVNELGQESIISRANGSWSLIPGGMRFVKLHKGDIVLNHLQTRSLIRDGQIKSLKTPSFANGSISNVKASVSLTSPLENTASVVNAVNKNKSSEDKSDYDWIEVAIDRIEKAIDKLKNTADSAYKVISKRITSTYDQIVSINNQIEVQQKAYEKYMEKANSIALSDDLKKAVQLGSLNIAEYDSDTKQLIDDYKNWLDKANELKDGISDLHDELGSLYADAFEKVEEDYENQLKLISHLANTYENELDLLEEKGYLGGAVFYKAMQNSQQSTIDTLKKELEDLMYEYSLAMTSGEIEEYSEQWYDFNIKINDVKEDLQDANKELVEINNNLRDLEWDIFDYAIDRIETLNDEADFLIELLSENDLFDENGNITNDGLATMSLHAQSYASYMNQASTYANELLNINNQLADNPYDTELIKRKEKLVKAQQDAIKSANKEKKSIVDLTKEGYNNQINSLKELISTYKESLDSSKSLYEYQQKIEEKSSKVAKLQKQLSAYSNDTSLETRATVQKLKLELEDAQKDLQETEYDQFISDSKKLLDDLSSDYEDFLNERLDDTNAILESAITQVDESALQICDAITNATENVGYVLSDSITNVLSNIGIVGSINSVNSELNGIKSAVFKMAGINDDSYANAINGISSSNAVDSSVGKLVEDKPVVEEVVEEEKTNTVDDTTKRKVAAAIWHGVGGWGNGARKGSERYDKLVEVFGENNGIQDLINQGVGKTDKDGISSYSYSAMRKKFKGYRTGGIVDYTGLAMVHGSPGTPETFFNAEDSKNIITLIDVLRQQSTKNLLGGYGNMNSVSLNGILDNSYINDYLLRGSGIVQNNVGDININIPIDHVENYDDIVNEMTKDDKFASFIRSITIDPLTGQSTIRKNLNRW